jgi:site-specific DNA-cytosine methylase
MCCPRAKDFALPQTRSRIYMVILDGMKFPDAEVIFEKIDFLLAEFQSHVLELSVNRQK